MSVRNKNVISDKNKHKNLDQLQHLKEEKKKNLCNVQSVVPKLVTKNYISIGRTYISTNSRSRNKNYNQIAILQLFTVFT